MLELVQAVLQAVLGDDIRCNFKDYSPIFVQFVHILSLGDNKCTGRIWDSSRTIGSKKGRRIHEGSARRTDIY